MDPIMEYVKPELVIVAVALYILGMFLKQTTMVLDKYIPVILGIVGVVLCAIWVFATTSVGSPQDIALAIFTAVIQGILVAGASTYVNQIVKQSGKEE